MEADLGKLAARLTRRALDQLQKVKKGQQATAIDCPARRLEELKQGGCIPG